MKQLPVVSCLLLLVSWVACAPVPLGSYPSSYVVNALSAKLADFLDPADLDCESCKIIVGVLQQLMMRNATEDDITHIIARICIDLKIEDQHVCKLIVVEFKDEVLTVAAEVGLSAREVCGVLVGPSCGDPYDPWHQEWNISVPDNKPPVAPIPNPKAGSPVNRILHLSDIHVDLSYRPGLSNDCGEPICCRPPNKPGSGSTASGYWGDYNCDLPLHTLVNLMKHLASVKDQFDWVYLTGDLPPHNVWNQSRSDQLFVIKTVISLLKQYLPDKQVLPSLGNHEGVPVNSFPPPFVTGERSDQWLLQAVSDLWGPWLDTEAQSTLLRGGFYSIKVRDGLRVISLQTNFASNLNFWLLINDTDPAGQLQWLVQQLTDAEKAGDKVHIIGHIPPNAFMHSFGWNYHRIVNRFESTIAGQFFGHTHKDSFRIFFDEHNITRATSIAYVGPSVTSQTHLNMGFRIYTIDASDSNPSRAVLDHETYILNVSDANLHKDPIWRLEYSAKNAYGMTSLHPADWAELVDRFEKDDALFQKFYTYMWKSHSPPCDSHCKASTLCDLVTSRAGDNSACIKKLLPGMSMADVQRHRYQNNVC